MGRVQVDGAAADMGEEVTPERAAFPPAAVQAQAAVPEVRAAVVGVEQEARAAEAAGVVGGGGGGGGAGGGGGGAPGAGGGGGWGGGGGGGNGGGGR